MAYADAVLAKGAVLNWPLGEASGTTADDLTAGGFAGVIEGSPTLGEPGFTYGVTAIEFDGIDDHVTVEGAGNVITAATAATIEIWVEADTPPAAYSYLGVLDGDAQFYVDMIDTGVLRVGTSVDGGFTDEAGTTVVTDDEDHHVVATWDDATQMVTLYVDAVEELSFTIGAGIAPDFTDIGVGAWPDVGFVDSPFAGKLGQFAVYPTALTAEQVAENYAIGIATPVEVESEINRDGAIVFDNIGEAFWAPAVVPPIDALPENRVVAFAYAPPTINGTHLLLDITEKAEAAYRDQIIVNGKDISFWRGIATPSMDWQRIQPLGHGDGKLRLPQVVMPFETPGEGELSWLTEDAAVLVRSVDPATNEVVGGRDWRGFVASFDIDGGDLVVNCGGHAAGSAAFQDRQMQLVQQRADAGLLVARAIRNIGLKHEPWAGAETGIRLIRWGGGNLLDYINELVAKMTTVDGEQWTVMPDDNDVYRTTLRDNETIHGTVYFDKFRVKPSLHRDMSEEPNRIFASGITPSGMAVKFGMYPGLIQGPPAPYPMADNSTFGPGTTNGDTDTGDGITVMGWQLATTGFLDERPSYVTYDAEVARAIKALQKQAGLSQTGNMSPNTWKALYNLSVTGFNLRNIRIRPAAQDPEVNPWRQSSNGSIIGRNPNYKPNKKRRDRTVPMGSGLKRSEIQRHAENLLPDGPQWRGTIEIYTGAIIAGEHTPGDPITALLRSRDIWPGMNLWAPCWAGGTLFHVAGVSVTEDGKKVTLIVDTRPGNTLQVWEAVQRDRESRNTVHRSFFRDRRASAFDRENTYDEVGGIISPQQLNPNDWTVFPVVAKQAGVIERIRVNLTPNREFVLAVFAREISEKRLRAVTNAPLTRAGRKRWTEENVNRKLDRDYTVLFVAGSDEDPCGYSPGKKSEDGNLTGELDDRSGFPFITLASNNVDRSSVLYVAIWVGDNATVDGGRIMWPSAEEY